MVESEEGIAGGKWILAEMFQRRFAAGQQLEGCIILSIRPPQPMWHFAIRRTFIAFASRSLNSCPFLQAVMRASKCNLCECEMKRFRPRKIACIDLRQSNRYHFTISIIANVWVHCHIVVTVIEAQLLILFDMGGLTEMLLEKQEEIMHNKDTIRYWSTR
uniref:Uncharacterized protein n=1 Tax=Ascaris lumbricoides TaxID=6252 RepID=A0A9J2Q5C6_ASCLU